MTSHKAPRFFLPNEYCALPQLAAASVAGLLLVLGARTARGAELRAGVANIDITPEQPVTLAGYASEAANGQ